MTATTSTTDHNQHQHGHHNHQHGYCRDDNLGNTTIRRKHVIFEEEVYLCRDPDDQDKRIIPPRRVSRRRRLLMSLSPYLTATTLQLRFLRQKESGYGAAHLSSWLLGSKTYYSFSNLSHMTRPFWPLSSTTTNEYLPCPLWSLCTNGKGEVKSSPSTSMADLRHTPESSRLCIVDVLRHKRREATLILLVMVILWTILTSPIRVDDSKDSTSIVYLGLSGTVTAGLVLCYYYWWRRQGNHRSGGSGSVRWQQRRWPRFRPNFLKFILF